MLTIIICVVGVYLYLYKEHCREVGVYMEHKEAEALLENKHRTELAIQCLHKHGRVFNRQGI